MLVHAYTLSSPELRQGYVTSLCLKKLRKKKKKERKKKEKEKKKKGKRKKEKQESKSSRKYIK
jgi:hypothetical protein